jgi:hypothetical protein
MYKTVSLVIKTFAVESVPDRLFLRLKWNTFKVVLRPAACPVSVSAIHLEPMTDFYYCQTVGGALSDERKSL